ncbi:MAG TPA: hypothetical protein VKY92_12045 [Verrucomicrobiae bacterium]|nr:hypothetical protein [Verrucomicrobiae bacterium]
MKPLPPAPFRAVQENRFEALKSTLLGEQLDSVWRPELTVVIRRAANEAAALAWVTPYPLLTFPLLFEEKAEAAVRFAAEQDRIRERSRSLYAV